MDIAVFLAIVVMFVLMAVILFWRKGKDEPSGTIVVIKGGPKLVYSIELDEDPENLQYRNRILFRVKTELVEDSDAK